MNDLKEIYVGFKDGKLYRRENKKMIYFDKESANRNIDKFARIDASLNYEGEKLWVDLTEDERKFYINEARRSLSIKNICIEIKSYINRIFFIKTIYIFLYI